MEATRFELGQTSKNQDTLSVLFSAENKTVFLS